MKMKWKIMAVGLAIALVVIAVVAYSTYTVKEPVDVVKVREYADPIAENILLAMNENNYTKFSKHFDEMMKNALPHAVFNETNAMIKSKIGDYSSKEFWKAEVEGPITIVYYKAKFIQEPEVIIKVGFQKILGEMKVSGLFFDSPKLRE